MTERLLIRKCNWCGRYFLGRATNCSNKCLSELRSYNIQGDKNPMYNSKRFGELNPNWKGGLSFDEYSEEFNTQLKELIKNRDNRECQLCYKKEKDCINKKGICYSLQIHHIDYNKNNNLPKNLITLCNSCHSTTNFNRLFWQSLLSKQMEFDR